MAAAAEPAASRREQDRYCRGRRISQSAFSEAKKAALSPKKPRCAGGRRRERNLPAPCPHPSPPTHPSSSKLQPPPQARSRPCSPTPSSPPPLNPALPLHQTPP
ncbi:hypothetical protein ACP70R_038223 [Stipagrostis hirtigluma subsp. patula]